MMGLVPVIRSFFTQAGSAKDAVDSGPWGPQLLKFLGNLPGFIDYEATGSTPGEQNLWLKNYRGPQSHRSGPVLNMRSGQ